MAFHWKDELSVGFGKIDEQHKELFRRYNSLLEACREGKGREAIMPVLDFMIEYVTTHFAEEERFMQETGYPQMQDHVKAHRELFRYVSEVHDELQEKGATVGVITSINHTLFNWLLRHVKQTDAMLGRHLAAQAA